MCVCLGTDGQEDMAADEEGEAEDGEKSESEGCPPAVILSLFFSVPWISLKKDKVPLFRE